MRSTKAIYAVERLKNRSGNPLYAAVNMPGGLFYLIDKTDGGSKAMCEPMPLDAFVAFVEQISTKPRKLSKLDTAFEKQIKKSRS
jgi:hypothetical protein